MTDRVDENVSLADLFVETRWCHETTAHESHNWSESGRDFFCPGVAAE